MLTGGKKGHDTTRMQVNCLKVVVSSFRLIGLDLTDIKILFGTSIQKYSHVHKINFNRNNVKKIIFF